MADKEEIKTLEELEEKGRILREYKEKFRQMCQENKMIKGSTVLKLYAVSYTHLTLPTKRIV